MILMFAEHMSHITPEDRELYRDFFRRDGQRYGNSWFYVTQAANGSGDEGLGYKYHDGNSLITVASFIRPCNDEECVHLIRPVDERVMEKVAKLAGMHDGPVYVKNISLDQRNYLLARGFMPVQAYPWHPEAPREDSTFDGQVLDIEKTWDLVRPNRSNPAFRRAVKFGRF